MSPPSSEVYERNVMMVVVQWSTNADKGRLPGQSPARASQGGRQVQRGWNGKEDSHWWRGLDRTVRDLLLCWVRHRGDHDGSRCSFPRGESGMPREVVSRSQGKGIFVQGATIWTSLNQITHDMITFFDPNREPLGMRRFRISRTWSRSSTRLWDFLQQTTGER